MAKYDPKFCAMLPVHMSNGASFLSFGAKLYEMGIKVTRTTMYEWVEKYPDWAHAKGVGEILSRAHWEGIGYGLATGQIDGNVTSYIFNVKARFPEYRDRAIDADEDNESNAALQALPSAKILTLLKSRK